MNRGRGVLAVLLVAAVSAALAFGQGTFELKALDDEYSRGMDLARRGKIDEGIALLKKTVATATGENLDIAQTGLGAAYRMAGKLGDARATLKSAIDRSAYGPALIEMARTYLYAPPFEPKKAIGFLKMVLAKNAKDVEALLELAHAHVNDEALDQAEAVYHKLTEEIAPKELRGWFGLGGVYIQKKRFDKAKTVFRMALSMEPKNPETHFKMGEMTMADEAEPGHLQKSVGWYERAVEMGRDNPKYYGALTYAYYRAGNNLAAAPVVQRLEAFAPNSSQARWSRGVLFEYQGKVAEAVRYYREAVLLDPGDVYSQYSLGVALSGKKNGDFVTMGGDRDWKYLPHRNIDQAATALKTALALNPAFPFAPKARVLIDELQSTATDRPVVTPEMEEMRKKQAEHYRIRAKMF